MLLRGTLLPAIAVGSTLLLTACTDEGTLPTLFGDLKMGQSEDTAISNLREYIADTFPVEDDEVRSLTLRMGVPGLHKTGLKAGDYINSSIVRNDNDETVASYLEVDNRDKHSELSSGGLIDLYVERYGATTCWRQQSGLKIIWFLNEDFEMMGIQSSEENSSHNAHWRDCEDVLQSAQVAFSRRYESNGLFRDGFSKHYEVMEDLRYVVTLAIRGGEETPFSTLSASYIDVSHEMPSALAAYNEKYPR